MRFSIPDSLLESTNVLIAGAGGGFDIFAGLPLYFALRKLGKRVVLANLSFSYLGGTDAVQPVPGTYRITKGTSAPGAYFPEGVLAQYLESTGLDCPLYAFEKSGVRRVQSGYRYIAQQHDIDAIVLVDGGTDILMRGDESGLGTPEEDMVSLASVSTIEVPTRLVYCLGFGIDAFHGVCHAHFLENVAALSQSGGFRGTMSLLQDMDESTFYLDAVRFSEVRMPNHASIVNTSIASALEGAFGNVHRTERTKTSELFISPLMSMYWVFDLPTLVRRSLYLDRLMDTESIWDVQKEIELFRSSQKPRDYRSIPH